MTDVDVPTADPDEDEAGHPLIDVELPSGQITQVRTAREAADIEDRVAEYRESFAFTNPADLTTLDMIVTMEMLVARWLRWQAVGVDDWGMPVNVKQLSESTKQTSTEVRQLRSALGMDKKTRDRLSGDGSIPEFIARLKAGAKAMGLYRHRQLDLVLEHGFQLITLASIWKNGDEEEQAIYGCTAPEVCDWIVTVFQPALEAASLEFANNDQRYWIHDM